MTYTCCPGLSKMKDLFTPASLLGPGNNNARTCPNLAALADKGDPLVMVAD